jgi:hypothetical protein
MLVTGPLVHSKTILLIISFLLITNLSFSQKFPDPFVHNLLKKGIKNIVAQDYDEARLNFYQLEKVRKDLPFGKIYLAATEIAESFDYEKPFNQKLILKYLEDAEKISERRLKENKNDVWNNYFVALTEGYSAYYEALNSNWFSAFSKGLTSVSSFEECLNLDKDFYESLIAIGTYKFWKSRKTEFLDWLPFISNDKDIGIELLRKASKYSDYNSHLAIHSLIWIYIDQKNYQGAVELAEQALAVHPNSRIFKWGLARAYEDINPEKAVNLYYDILNSYPKNLTNNKVNIITLKHLIAQQLVKLKRFEEAIQLCDEILAIKGLNEFEMDRLGNRLERVRSLKAELSKK